MFSDYRGKSNPSELGESGKALWRWWPLGLVFKDAQNFDHLGWEHGEHGDGEGHLSGENYIGKGGKKNMCKGLQEVGAQF